MTAARSLTQPLFERYRATGDPAARAELLDRHLGLVQTIAREVLARLPRAVELDDLVSAGALGLVSALEAFDPLRGLEFSTFATPRIRGAVLDELRAQDWVPRSVRRRSRAVAAAISTLEHRLGRAPRPREIAEQLRIGLDEYWRWRYDIDRATLANVVPGQEGSGDGLVHPSTSDGVSVTAGDDDLDRGDEARSLRDQIAELPPNERTVLALYYYEDLTLRQIGEVLHLTESRISQIRTRALRRLRERLGARAGVP
ncbi:MAG TPA: FliA/WhiG family RNA polymerase sigma factor [Gemmatimonadales bacterium]|nr:FliA/WhiG family RNA polymerase sigma factor [Gemmatimonadales bacterium]